MPTLRRSDALAGGAAFFAFILLASAAASGQQPKDSAEMGLGVNSCAGFSAMYERDPATTEATFFTWAQGFMSAINMVLLGREHQPSTNLAQWDVDKQKRHIRSYCAANPSRAYDEGVFDLFEAMRKEQGLPSLVR